MPQVHTKCRVCHSQKLQLLLDLGNQPLSGVFPRPEVPDPARSPLELIQCEDCGLVQLRHTADLGSMYGATYGYYSSISPTMVRHLTDKVRHLKETVRLQKGDVVLDIGCNDGTLLNAYGEEMGLKRVGMDPSSKKFIKSFQQDIEMIFDFFSAGPMRKLIGNRECKVITSIAMFYDLDDPLAFMKDIRSLLAQDGVWAFELSYLPLLLSQLTYDQICHEHVTYLGLRDLDRLMAKADLKVLDVSFNDLNGGSIYIYAGRKDTTVPRNDALVEKVLREEEPLSSPAVFERLKLRVQSHRDEVRHFLELAKQAGKRVYGYGASTKGNIVLNYAGIGPEHLIAIGDKNPEKDGLVTPGSRIPIISHEELRQKEADYLFVLIWHFRAEVIRDEIEYLKRGGKLVFDLPRLHVVDASNYQRYLDHNFEDLAFSL